MTATNPLQLHLFDATPDPETMPSDRRRRLLTLTGMLLNEAAGDQTEVAADVQPPSLAEETEDE
ncbi:MULTISPECIES: hypothetical protein [Alphaproteobacteria]|jgi:hypothetical protein|uniref:Uncharacterized protein n=1 Tax=Marivita cryptomonadis TaxID=505252 RepID=A0A9Q2P282_9RHOB|nr:MULTISPECIES: hypothetical protein [Marivita]MCR9170821.1 hypothetical protein [Paracoccaceae bacterium]MBM2324360.1 hypothetical protein [Marivita cryptomonadis]MBM2333953.1 hypothetical protein [Marivita cryptomonadis]MBM2343526.1 hypothetical protein [Marivita cryptomonadis]MBM2348204.1 hypothetical protein [Marivita cryptomonadis]